MDERPKVSGPAGFFRGTLSGDGRPGPIEQRLGRRLVRLIDPESEEGMQLLGAGQVDLIGPDGKNLGRLTPQEVYLCLRQRLERCLADPNEGTNPQELEDGLSRVQAWSKRIDRS